MTNDLNLYRTLRMFLTRPILVMEVVQVKVPPWRPVLSNDPLKGDILRNLAAYFCQNYLMQSKNLNTEQWCLKVLDRSLHVRWATVYRNCRSCEPRRIHHGLSVACYFLHLPALTYFYSSFNLTFFVGELDTHGLTESNRGCEPGVGVLTGLTDGTMQSAFLDRRKTLAMIELLSRTTNTRIGYFSPSYKTKLYYCTVFLIHAVSDCCIFLFNAVFDVLYIVSISIEYLALKGLSPVGCNMTNALKSMQFILHDRHLWLLPNIVQPDILRCRKHSGHTETKWSRYLYTVTV